MSSQTSLQVHDAAAIAARLTGPLRHWRHQDGRLVRLYRTGGWKGTLMAVNAIGHLAEAAWHHPEIIATYASVEVRLDTHDAGGVTDRDFELAERIEAFVLWRPAADGALEGTPVEAAHLYIRYDE
jgi:4a-hydroxytetrahydrobiopterin dehydratase